MKSVTGKVFGNRTSVQVGLSQFRFVRFVTSSTLHLVMRKRLLKTAFVSQKHNRFFTYPLITSYLV